MDKKQMLKIALGISFGGGLVIFIMGLLYGEE